MAESITAVKDYKASPSLGKETIYKNWKKFMTLIEKAREAILNMDKEALTAQTV